MKKSGRFGYLFILILLLNSGCDFDYDYRKALLGAFYPAWKEVFGEYCHGEKPKPGCNYYVIEEKDTLPADVFNFRFFFDKHVFEREKEKKEINDWCYIAQVQMAENFEETCLNENGDDVIEKPIDRLVDADLYKICRALGLEFAKKNNLPEETGIEKACQLENFALQGKYFEKRDLLKFADDFYGVSLKKLADTVKESQENPEVIKEVNKKVAAHWKADPKVTQPVLERWAKEALVKTGTADLADKMINFK